MKALTLTGAKLKVVINNATIGFVTDFSWTINYDKRAIRGIDVPFPQEIAPGAQSIRGTVRCVRLKDVGGLESYGVVAEQGRSTTGGEGATDRLSDIQIEKYISIQLIDRASDKTVLQLEKATVLSQTWAVKARGLLTGSFDFEGFFQTPLS